MVRIQRVILDGFYRHTGSNSNPVFILPNSGLKATKCYIKSISIPHSFYNITQYNNKIYWRDSVLVAVPITSTIPVGDYTLTELLTEIGIQMTADTTDALTYTASVNVKTNKVTITNSGAANFVIDGTDGVDFTGLLILLGFYGTTDTGIQRQGDHGRMQLTFFTGASTYTGTDTVYIGVKYIYVRSNLTVYSNNYDSVTLKYDKSTEKLDKCRTDFIAFIPVTTNYGDMIEWNIGNDIVKFDINSHITNLEFELLDENFNRLNLNGRSWAIELVFEC